MHQRERELPQETETRSRTHIMGCVHKWVLTYGWCPDDWILTYGWCPEQATFKKVFHIFPLERRNTGITFSLPEEQDFAIPIKVCPFT